ncbi:MAG: DUF4197 domain-containing protein [Gammaproteobacteria bacterium]
MPRYLMLLLLVLISPSQVQAGDWWQRGLEMLKGGGSDTARSSAALTNADIAAGLREALRVGTGNVVNHLARENGYYNDPKAHIPLPQSLDNVRDTLATIGMSSMLDDLELRMNRAAELAAPKARGMFVDAIQSMTLDDARQIYSGPDDAATRYFQGRMSTPLAAEFKPVINTALAEAGAIQSYDRLVSRYEQLPFVPDLKANLAEHVTDYATNAIFDYLAVEEAAIRQNPAKRTTEILQQVFGR